MTVPVDSLGEQPIYGAAYQMMDRAYVRLEGDRRKKLAVILRPKPGHCAESLRPDFESELKAQKFRWSVARSGQPIREYLIENAVALAQELEDRRSAQASQKSAEEPLTADQKSEIARLIAEVEAEISQMNAGADGCAPKTSAVSWEAAQKPEEPRS